MVLYSLFSLPHVTTCVVVFLAQKHYSYSIYMSCIFVLGVSVCICFYHFDFGNWKCPDSVGFFPLYCHINSN